MVKAVEAAIALKTVRCTRRAPQPTCLAPAVCHHVALLVDAVPSRSRERRVRVLSVPRWLLV